MGSLLGYLGVYGSYHYDYEDIPLTDEHIRRFALSHCY